MNTILIIDDDPANLSIILSHLQQANLKLLIAENGQLGLERAKQVQPDLILLDVIMPGLDGFEVCHLLKLDATTRAIPIIFMTSLTDPVDKVRGFEVGGVDFLSKPLHAQEVLARVHAHLTIKQLQQSLEARNDLLETEVSARVAQLQASQEELQQEMAHRQHVEAERARLYTMMTQQNEQLRQLTEQLLTNQKQNQQALHQTLYQQLKNNLGYLQDNLEQLQNQLERLSIKDDQNPLTLLDVSMRFLAQSFDQLATIQHKLEQMETEQASLGQNPLLRLSTREQEVLALLQQGKKTADIAQILHISPSSVYTYRQRVIQKLEAKTLAEALQHAFELQQGEA